MKNIKLNITSVITLVLGLLLGWVFFGGSSNEDEGHPHTTDAASEKWTCSMHPQVQQDNGGKCPFCGMDLIPLAQNENQDETILEMSANAVKMANIQTSVVKSGSSESNIRINGRIETDEGLVQSQVLHIPGRIEKLYIEFTGERIRRGQRIATIYSPELITAQKELREAIKLEDQYPALAAAARKKFENWKLSSEQVRQIEKSKDVQTNFDITADISGIVTTRSVQTGDHVEQGGILFEVSDLNRVWAIFDVYERDLGKIRMGDVIRFSVKAYPGEEFGGEIEFIDPVINPISRTASIRVSVGNPGGKLKPEMLAEGIIKSSTTSKEAIMIPKSAVLWTGKRSLVYLQVNEDKPGFQMKEVTLGSLIDDNYIIEDGLNEGDKVVTNGVFSIDAAAQLQGKQSMMNPPGGETSAGHNHGDMKMDDAGQMDHPEVNISNQTFEVSGDFQNQLKKIYDNYLPVKDALIQTDARTAKSKAAPLLAAINGVNMTLVKGDAHMEWMKDLAVLRTSTETILSQVDVEKIREQLSPLSDQLYQTIIKFRVETGGYRQYCPMAFDFKGAFWLSDSEKVLNPYFGDEMLTCGNVEEELN